MDAFKRVGHDGFKVGKSFLGSRAKLSATYHKIHDPPKAELKVVSK